MDDSYFIPKELKIDSMSTREILSKAILVRDIRRQMPEKIIKLITFKIKEFDKEGNIKKQENIDCNILEIEEAKKILEAIGYNEIMRIKENNIVYEKDGFQLAIKNIENGDNLIEIEENNELNTIQKLKDKLNKLDIPIYTDNYFIKKAEIELDKKLKIL